MLFNSIAFMLYLPIVFVFYWFVFKQLKVQNAFVVVASYIFYGWWDWRFLILIALTSLCSYASGIAIAHASSRRKQLSVLWANVLLNIGILGLFKYFNFFTRNLAALFQPMGITLDFVTINLILPVGISFYTFQALSYSIDVYRKKIPATHDIIAFLAFISFFPQLVAGPIERATNLLPQFLRPRKFDYDNAVDGCRQILWGLFKKMVIADNCATFVNTVFSDYTHMGGINLWLGAICFTFQIYGDFSGYSDIAIGVARLFGVKLMRNFNVPYFSRDIAEFWRRWHMSLTTWFRDYIYIPLGGSRCSKGKVVRNTFIIFLVSGFWHGAEWTFIAWGGYHALLFMPLILSNKNRKYTDTVASSHFFPTMGESTAMAFTFLLVLIGWVLFRAENIHMAGAYIYRMLTNYTFVGASPARYVIIFIAFMLGVEWINRHKAHPFSISEHGLFKYRVARWFFYMLIAFICISMHGVQGQFIYFQF